ncbi:MAG: hypothetical protein ACYC67_10495 [Prosthecobacter sp.]
MKLPQELVKYQGKIAEADDNALVKVRTLKAWLAAVVGMIPRSGSNIKIRRSPTGDVWSSLGSGAVVETPWQIDATGHIYPAYVGPCMPTLGTEPLNTTAHVLDLTADGDYVYFKLNFTVGWVESFLASWSLDSVSVEQGSSLPADDADTKYLPFNTITAGAATGASYFNRSISIRLVDNGISATRLEYNS